MADLHVPVLLTLGVTLGQTAVTVWAFHRIQQDTAAFRSIAETLEWLRKNYHIPAPSTYPPKSPYDLSTRPAPQRPR